MGAENKTRNLVGTRLRRGHVARRPVSSVDGDCRS